MAKDKYVFLDRDGTLNKDLGYISSVEEFNGSIYHDTRAFINALKQMGYKIVVVSNQSGIGRGIIKESEVRKMNDVLIGMGVDEVLYCPHKPEDNCECRKPSTAMVKHLIPKIDKERSWVVGDKDSDVEFGKRLGLKAIKIWTEEVHPEYSALVLSDVHTIIRTHELRRYA